MRISHASLDEVTCCRHFQLPSGRDNSVLHHPRTGIAPATYERGALIPPPHGVSDGVGAGGRGGAAVLCSKFVPEEKREHALVPLGKP